MARQKKTEETSKTEDVVVETEVKNALVELQPEVEPVAEEVAPEPTAEEEAPVFKLTSEELADLEEVHNVYLQRYRATSNVDARRVMQRRLATLSKVMNELK